MIKFEKSLVSKVLVFEEDQDIQAIIKNYCDDNGLIAVKQNSYSAIKVLHSNTWAAC